MNTGNTGRSKRSAVRGRPVAWALLGLGFAGSLFMFIARGGPVESFLLVVLGLLAAQSAVLPRLALAQATAVRTFAQDSQGQQKLAAELTIRWRSALPFVWFSVQDALHNQSRVAADGTCQIRSSWSCGLARVAVLAYELPELTRGVYSWSEVRLSAGDLLGLTVVERTLELKGGFLVTPSSPSLLSAPRLFSAQGLAPGRAQPDSDGGWLPTDNVMAAEQEARRAMMQPGGNEDLRAYREGDSLRHVDWRIAARGLGWVTRVHAPGNPAQQILVLDTALAAYQREERLFDLAAGSLLLLGREALARGERVLLGLPQEQQLAQTLYTGAGDVAVLARALAAARMQQAGVDWQAASDQLTPSAGAVHVVTADWKSADWKRLGARLGAAGSRLMLLVVSRSHVPSFAMREQQQLLEASGVRLQWLMQAPGSAPAARQAAGAGRAMGGEAGAAAGSSSPGAAGAAGAGYAGSIARAAGAAGAGAVDVAGAGAGYGGSGQQAPVRAYAPARAAMNEGGEMQHGG